MSDGNAELAIIYTVYQPMSRIRTHHCLSKKNCYNYNFKLLFVNKCMIVYTYMYVATFVHK